MSAIDRSRDWGANKPARSPARLAIMLPPPSGVSWTDAELSEIERLQPLCRGLRGWEVVCDQSDAGDPWSIIYDRTQERIIVHIARINRRYIAVFPMHARSYWTATLRSAIDIALALRSAQRSVVR